MLRWLLILVLLPAWTAPSIAETLTVEASGDATLIEDPGGALANGVGPSLFVGRTGQTENGIRRGLLRFDLSAIPRDAIVEHVALTLHAIGGSSQPGPIRFHRILQRWREGPSFSGGGAGAPAQRGDVTWLHTMFDDALWRRPGGHHRMRSSGFRLVAGLGPQVWETKELAADVRLWVRAPYKNRGWILFGDESRPQTRKVFASRQHPDARVRPALRITYRTREGSKRGTVLLR